MRLPMFVVFVALLVLGPGTPQAQSTDQSQGAADNQQPTPAALPAFEAARAQARVVQMSEYGSRLVLETAYMKQRYDNELAMRAVQLSIYKNQLTMEYAIFALVVVIILSALYLAYAQFAVWARRNRSSEMPAVNALTINKDGIAISTPFVGLLMLVAAFAFFYMYVNTVYTITDKAESLRARTESSVYPSGKQEQSTAQAVQATNSASSKPAQ